MNATGETLSATSLDNFLSYSQNKLVLDYFRNQRSLKKETNSLVLMNDCFTSKLLKNTRKFIHQVSLEIELKLDRSEMFLSRT